MQRETECRHIWWFGPSHLPVQRNLTWLWTWAGTVEQKIIKKKYESGTSISKDLQNLSLLCLSKTFSLLNISIRQTCFQRYHQQSLGYPYNVIGFLTSFLDRSWCLFQWGPTALKKLQKMFKPSNPISNFHLQHDNWAPKWEPHLPQLWSGVVSS